MRQLLICWMVIASPSWCYAGGLNGQDQAHSQVIIPSSPARAVSNGWYVGGTLSYAFGGDDRVGLFNGVEPRLTFATLENSGGALSVFAGWRRDQGVLSWGYELSFLAGDVGATTVGQGYTAQMSLNAAYTIRLMGSVPVAERTAVYSFGGVSHGDFYYRVAGDGPVGPVAIDTSLSEWGYAVGIGLEHEIGVNWTIRVEYEYMNFGSTVLRDLGGTDTVATPNFGIVQVGLSYQF